MFPYHYERLARAMYPRNPAFAAEIAKRAGTTVEALGLVPRPSAPAPAAAAPRPAILAPAAAAVASSAVPSSNVAAAHADAILCAVAERLDVSPRQLRPALAAGFARAAELGLTAEQVARAFAAAGPREP